MRGVDYVGLGVFLLFLVLLVTFAFFGRRRPIELRRISVFEDLKTAIERAVEAGERVHLSLGTGSVIGTDYAPALSGLAMLSHVAAATAMSDKPVIVTAGDGAMTTLAQEVVRSAYEKAKTTTRYQSNSSRLIGPTPLSYVAGIPILLDTEDVSVHILMGSFGPEGALAADVGQRHQVFVLAGTDDIQSQSLLFATAENTLIGEEVFAGGAYLTGNLLHLASLQAQDVIRLLIVVVILIGTLMRTLGVSF
jgi:hypothetical protein